MNTPSITILNGGEGLIEMKGKLKIYLKLFFIFFKISPVTFGGGYAMISVIEKEIVKKGKLIEEDEIIDIFTIAQTLPGAIAVNSATLIGYRIAGTLGSIAALLGIVVPALIIVILASITYQELQNNPLVTAAFKGIAAAVIALIVYAGITIGKTAIKDVSTLIIALIYLILLILLPINPIIFILMGIITGLVINKIRAV